MPDHFVPVAQKREHLVTAATSAAVQCHFKFVADVQYMFHRIFWKPFHILADK